MYETRSDITMNRIVKLEIDEQLISKNIYRANVLYMKGKHFSNYGTKKEETHVNESVFVALFAHSSSGFDSCPGTGVPSPFDCCEALAAVATIRWWCCMHLPFAREDRLQFGTSQRLPPPCLAQ